MTYVCVRIMRIQNQCAVYPASQESDLIAQEMFPIPSPYVACANPKPPELSSALSADTVESAQLPNPNIKDLVMHENSGRFLDWIFPLYLGEYDWYSVQVPARKSGRSSAGPGEENLRTVMLSPRHFGWLQTRPRLYSLGMRSS